MIARWLGCLVLIFFVFLFYLLSRSSFDFTSVKEGVEYKDVVYLLGEPAQLRRGKEICNFKILRPVECESFLGQGSVEIGYWKLGVDTWGVVGFSERKTVIKKLLLDT